MLVSIIKTLATAILGIAVITFVVGEKRSSARDAGYRLSASFPVPILRPDGMCGRVFLPSYQDQILQQVVQSIAVNMVDNFSIDDGATEMVGHYEPMLRDITDVSFCEGVWMVWPQHVGVTIGSNKSAALPIWVAWSSVGMARNKTSVTTFGDSPQRRRARGKRLAASAFAFHNEGPFIGIIHRSRRLSQGGKYA
ncbi:hypothetical protein LCGC14_1595070 [marine sediment metagenome]|uniref:Uncharacterized protein n=1 Tax=marine sediment metagenome TaxID=412755 RepID=A0A0F9KTJ7_9ZZZZ